MNDINYVNINGVMNSFKNFKGATPFDHCLVDNFISTSLLEKLQSEFPAYDSEIWYEYNNKIEHKRAQNNWNLFPEYTYKFFQYLNSNEFIDLLSGLYGKKLYPDYGLHGGGWHIHKKGGNLNPHLDYDIHPKLRMKRVINLIIYLTKDYREEYEGKLGLWEHDAVNEIPGKLAKEILPVENRAIFFDTTQNSWHGMSNQMSNQGGDIYRRSLAIYYLAKANDVDGKRERALFAGRESQRNDLEVEELIKLRSGVETSKNVYRK